MVKSSSVMETLRLAQMDLALAKNSQLTMRPIPYEAICYHSQQCVEKLLKAYLMANEKTPEKIHKLDVLNRECTKIDKDFSNIIVDCVELNEYGVKPKYEHQLPMNDDVIKAAITSAKNVEKFILKKLGLEHMIIKDDEIDKEVKDSIFEMLDCNVPLDSIKKLAKVNNEAFTKVLQEYDELGEKKNILKKSMDEKF